MPHCSPQFCHGLIPAAGDHRPHSEELGNAGGAAGASFTSATRLAPKNTLFKGNYTSDDSVSRKHNTLCQVSVMEE